MPRDPMPMLYAHALSLNFHVINLIAKSRLTISLHWMTAYDLSDLWSIGQS